MSGILFMILVFVVLPIAAQIVICEKTKKIKSKAGLVLPAILLVVSLVYVLFGIAALESQNTFSVISTVFFTLLITNVPTLVLYAIYLLYAVKNRRGDELEKMKLQDL
jgi:uncharacterized membrane-anchored protein